MKTMIPARRLQTCVVRRQARGSVLFVALFFVLLATALMLAVSSATFTNSTRTSDYVDRESSYYAARGLNDLMLSDLNDRHANSGTADLQSYLNGYYTWSPNLIVGVDALADSLRITSVNGTIDATIVVKRADVTTWNGLVMGKMQPARVRLYRRDRTSASGYIKYTDMLIVTEAVPAGKYSSTMLSAALANPRAYPDIDASWFCSLATNQDPPEYSGFDYAILTKNLTCTLCHLRVRDLYRAKNTDTSRYNGFGRIKVGTTNYLACRTGSANTNIEGTLYHRGKLEEESSGAAISAATFTSSTVKGVKFNGTSPVTIFQNTTTGAVTTQAFVNNSSGTVDAVTGAGNTAPAAANGTLYLNYPLDSTKQSDGALPTADFPAPFADTAKVLPNNPSKTVPNSKVDPDEVAAAIAQFTNAANAGASITGGVCVTGFSATTPFTGTALPASGTAASLSNGYVGNVILTGTTANPIKLNGSVVIDGDVMINGVVEGTGQIYATGSVYVPGDVKYKNKMNGSNEIFGVSESGGSNLLGLVAGKNIIIGDYLSSVTHWDSSKPDFYKPNLDGTGGKAGTPEPAKKIQYAKNTGVTPKTESGTQNPYTDLGGAYATTDLQNNNINGMNMANFVVEQLAVFNREEFTKTLPHVPTNNPLIPGSYTSGVDNPYYMKDSAGNPNYVPRYYTFYPDNYNPYSDATTTTPKTAGNVPTKANPIQMFITSSTPWSTANNKWNASGDPHCYGMINELADFPAAAQSPLVSDASKISIHPDWMSPADMLKLIANTEAARTSGDPRRIDGLLYTNNAIFAVERKQAQAYNAGTNTWSKVGSKSSGTMVVNGGLVAPDLGVLVTGNAADAFTVNYDARVKSFLPITATDTGMWSGFARSGVSHGSGLLP